MLKLPPFSREAILFFPVAFAYLRAKKDVRKSFPIPTENVKSGFPISVIKRDKSCSTNVEPLQTIPSAAQKITSKPSNFRCSQIWDRIVFKL